MFCSWQRVGFPFNSWCLNPERRKLNHPVEQNRALIKSPDVSSIAVGNPSTPRNQPSHRNVLRRNKQLRQLEMDAHLLRRLRREAAEPAQLSAGKVGEGGTKKSRINTTEESRAGPVLRLNVSFPTQPHFPINRARFVRGELSGLVLPTCNIVSTCKEETVVVLHKGLCWWDQSCPELAFVLRTGWHICTIPALQLFPWFQRSKVGY